MRAQLVIFVIIATIAGLGLQQPNIAGEARNAVVTCTANMQQGNWQGVAAYLFAVSPKLEVALQPLPADWLKEIVENGQFGPASRVLAQPESKYLARLTHGRIDLQAFAHPNGYIALAKKNGTWQIVSCRHRGQPEVFWPGSDMVWRGLELGNVILAQQGNTLELSWQQAGKLVKPVTHEITVEHVTPVVNKKPDTEVKPVEPQPVDNKPPDNQNANKPEDKQPPDASKPQPPVAVTTKYIFRFQNGIESETAVPLQATIKDLATGQLSDIGEEMELAPGRYEIELAQEGYKTYRQEIDTRNRPGEPVFFHYTFEPLPRQFFWRFRADSPEGEDIQPDTFTVNGATPAQSSMIQPGVCTIEASKDGYTTWREQFIIKAGKAPYFLSKTLQVRERELALDILDKESKQRLTPDKVTIQGEQITIDKPVMLKPGEYEISVNIASYQPITSKVVVAAGSGLYRLPLLMTKLVPAAVPEKQSTPNNAVVTLELDGETYTLDGIEYGYEFGVDGRLLPPQSVTIQRNGEQTTAALTIPEGGKQLRIDVGYCYAIYTLPQLPDKLQKFSHIALEAWKSHFEKMFRQAGKETTVEALSNFFANDALVTKMKQSNDPEALKELVMYIQDWPIPVQLLKQIEDSLYTEKK